MYGSPNRGLISTRDSTKPGMKDLVKTKVEHMHEGDAILKKSDASSKKQNMAVFTQVSFIELFSELLCPQKTHYVRNVNCNVFILCIHFRSIKWDVLQ